LSDSGKGLVWEDRKNTFYMKQAGVMILLRGCGAQKRNKREIKDEGARPRKWRLWGDWICFAWLFVTVKIL
jgi:hypothetical protein